MADVLTVNPDSDFSWNETKDIIKELYRILALNGCILLRVNSTKDRNFGAGQGKCANILLRQSIFKIGILPFSETSNSSVNNSLDL